MAIEVYDTKDSGGAQIIPGRRLYLDASRTKLVPQDHKDARYLYCTERQAVPRVEYERLMAGAAESREATGGQKEPPAPSEHPEPQKEEPGTTDQQVEAPAEQEDAERPIMRPDSRRERKKRS